jgi:hypothetical protein
MSPFPTFSDLPFSDLFRRPDADLPARSAAHV